MSSSLERNLPPLAVVGHGFFSTHHETPRDADRDVRRAPQRPAFPLLVARARRFTSLVTQLHIDVCGQALRSLPAGQLPYTVFASEHGETQVAADLISDLLAQGSVSSARFALSVHNAPSGLLSIATHNELATTTVSAGPSSFAAGLLEAFLVAHERRAHVLLSYADEPVPVLFGGDGLEPAFGVSLLLAPIDVATAGAGTVRLVEASGDAAWAAPSRSASALVVALIEGEAASVKVGSLRPGETLSVVATPPRSET